MIALHWPLILFVSATGSKKARPGATIARQRLAFRLLEVALASAGPETDDDSAAQNGGGA